MTKNFEHFFKCFLVNWDSSVDKSLFSNIPCFLIGLFGLLVSNFLSSLNTLDIRPLLDVELMEILSQSVAAHFVLLRVSFVLQKLFSFLRSHLLIVGLGTWGIRVQFRKLFLILMGSRLFPNFSSTAFSASSFMLRSLVYLDLRSVQDDKYRSICIFLHVDIQLEQHHLLKMLSVFHCMVLDYF